MKRLERGRQKADKRLASGKRMTKGWQVARGWQKAGKWQEDDKRLASGKRMKKGWQVARGWQKAGKLQDADKKFAKGWQESWLCVCFTWSFLASSQRHSPRTLLETGPGRAENNFSQIKLILCFLLLCCGSNTGTRRRQANIPELRIRILLVRIQIPVFASMRIQIPLFTLIADLDFCIKCYKHWDNDCKQYKYGTWTISWLSRHQVLSSTFGSTVTVAASPKYSSFCLHRASCSVDY